MHLVAYIRNVLFDPYSFTQRLSSWSYYTMTVLGHEIFES